MNHSALLTQKEAAAWLRISERTLRAWHRRGLPVVRCGPKVVRYRLEDLLRWLERQTEARSTEAEGFKP